MLPVAMLGLAHHHKGLDLIDRSVVFATYWTHPGDEITEWRHKSALTKAFPEVAGSRSRARYYA
jgi:hypothetical protein